MRNARVFISCGQRDEDEKKIGLAVEGFFKGKGFETYFAERVHSPDALTENIFKFLRQSEYFIYIDFQRDKLEGTGENRGSLFVNQEIAIATFLALEGIGFRQKDTLREGIENFQIYNAFDFENKSEIIERLEQETRDWDVSSVNELTISFNPSTVTRNVRLNNSNSISDWYHLEVINRNRKKHAFSCLGYVTKIENLDTEERLDLVSNELVWSGTGETSINIVADTRRDLDAFFLIEGKEFVFFHQRQIHTTNPRYNLPKLPQGKYLLEYTIISSNFDSVKKEFYVEFTGQRNSVNFREST